MMTIADTRRIQQDGHASAPEFYALSAPTRGAADDDDARVVIVYLLGGIAALAVLSGFALAWGL